MDFKAARLRMVEQQLRPRGISDERILEAFRRVPRELFVAKPWRRMVYRPWPVPIGHGATLSQPAAVARLVELAEIAPGDRVLDIGSGSGYQAAVLARLAAHVYGVEVVPELAARSRETLAGLGITNVTIHTGDGTLGLPEHAPYDRIIVMAAARKVPPALLEQMADGGSMMIPVGRALPRWWKVLLRVLFRRPGVHKLLCVRRRGEEYERELRGGMYVIPLKGEYEPLRKAARKQRLEPG